jgi:hypothetical protein
MKAIVLTFLVLALLALPGDTSADDRIYNLGWAKYDVSDRYDTMLFHQQLPRKPVEPTELRIRTSYHKVDPSPNPLQRTVASGLKGLVLGAAIRDGRPAVLALTAMSLTGTTPVTFREENTPLWLLRTMEIATEGLVFYAAMQGDNKPAMAAVTAIALTGGATGRTLRDGMRALLKGK